jgi:hypothetical protein
MFITLTPEQMRSRYRIALGLNTVRADCSIEEFDGIDIDSYLESLMRQWYLSMLDSASPCYLPKKTLGSELTRRQLGNGILVELPDDCRRVISAEVDGWSGPVIPYDFVHGARRIVACANPFAMPGTIEPLAVKRPDGIFLSPAKADDDLKLIAIIDPGPTSYVFDEALLQSLPSNPFSRI